MNSVRHFANHIGFSQSPISVRTMLAQFGTNSLRQAFSAAGIIIEANRYCGVEDDAAWLLHPSVNPLAHGGGQALWTKGNLTYSVDAGGAMGAAGNLSQAVVNGEMANVFWQWRMASNGFFTFAQVPTNGDIRIGFGGSEQYEKLGVAGGVLGVAWDPPSGMIWFDNQEVWSLVTPPPAGQESLRAVALHEVGHALGLQHSTVSTRLMYPYGPAVATIDPESIRAIQDMYAWAAQVALNEFSSDGPSLALARSSNLTSSFTWLYMGWKGMGDDQVIHVAEFDGSTFVRRQRLEAFRSSHGPVLATSCFTVTSQGSPTTGLFLAWKGERDDQTLFYAENPMLQGWSSFRAVPGAFSNARPALAAFNGQMVLAWKGMGNDQNIYTSSYNGAAWSPVRQIPGRATSHAPTLVAVGDRLYMFWKGIGDDQRIFHAWIDGSADAIWQGGREVQFNDARGEGMTLYNVFTDHHVGAAVRGGNVIVLAWKGMRGDPGLLFSTKHPDDEFFAGEIRIPFIGSSSGPTLVEFEGRIFMAWKAIDDERLYFSSLG